LLGITGITGLAGWGTTALAFSSTGKILKIDTVTGVVATLATTNFNWTGAAVQTRMTALNECLENNGGCAIDAICQDQVVGNKCTCELGFTGDGKTCQMDADSDYDLVPDTVDLDPLDSSTPGSLRPNTIYASRTEVPNLCLIDVASGTVDCSGNSLTKDNKPVFVKDIAIDRWGTLYATDNSSILRCSMDTRVCTSWKSLIGTNVGTWVEGATFVQAGLNGPILGPSGAAESLVLMGNTGNWFRNNNVQGTVAPFSTALGGDAFSVWGGKTYVVAAPITSPATPWVLATVHPSNGQVLATVGNTGSTTNAVGVAGWGGVAYIFESTGRIVKMNLTSGLATTFVTTTHNWTGAAVQTRQSFVNECSVNNGGCTALQTCVDTPTGFLCKPKSIKTFSYTGTQQSWTVPIGVTKVRVKVAGGGGGGGGSDAVAGSAGGAGGYTEADVPVTPGAALVVVVGGGGSGGSGCVAGAGAGSGGYLGGATGGKSGSTGCSGGGGGGGGLSGLYSGTPASNAVILAAGGGGGGGGGGTTNAQGVKTLGGNGCAQTSGGMFTQTGGLGGAHTGDGGGGGGGGGGLQGGSGGPADLTGDRSGYGGYGGTCGKTIKAVNFVTTAGGGGAGGAAQQPGKAGSVTIEWY
jgi:hypothetical protein